MLFFKKRTIPFLVASIFSQISFANGILVNNPDDSQLYSGQGKHYSCGDASQPCPSGKAFVTVASPEGRLNLDASDISVIGNTVDLKIENGGTAILTNTNLTADQSGNTIVSIDGTNSSLKMTNGSITHESGGIASGRAVSVKNGASLELNQVDITSKGSGGLEIINSASAKIHGGSISYLHPSFTGSVIHVDDGPYGKPAFLELDGVKVTSGKSASNAIYVYRSHVLIKGGTNILFHGNGPTIRMVTSSHLTLQDSSLTSTSHGSVGIDNGSSGGGDLNIINSHVITKGDTAIGINLYGGSTNISGNSTISTEKKDAIGLNISGGTTVNVDNLSINAKGKDAHGIRLAYNAKLDLKNSRIVTSGVDASALSIEHMNAPTMGKTVIEHSEFVSENAPTIRLDDTTGHLNIVGGKISNSSGGTAISLTRRSNANILNMSQGSEITGDAIADALSQNNELYFTSSGMAGAIQGIKTVTLGDNNSYWKVTKDSNITGDLNSNGIIIFDSSNTGFVNIKIGGNLNGSGQYHINTDLSQKTGDLIEVKGQVTGSNMVTIKDSGQEPSLEGQSHQIIKAGGDDNGKGSFTLANRGAVVNAGTYQYELKQDNASTDGQTGWSLVNTGRLSEQAEATGKQGDLALSQGLWVEQMNNLRKRLGDLRLTPETNGIWARTYGSKVDFDEGQFGQASQKFYGVALGYDRQLKLANGRLFVGARIDHANANQDLGSNNTGKIISNDIAAYFTYLADNGFYSDVLVSRSRRNNHLDVAQTDGSHADANYREYTRGMSVELGRMIQLQNNWFVEPQAELSHFYLGNTSYITSNGMAVKMGTGHSLTARLGALLGKKYDLGSSYGQWYVKGGAKSEIHANRDILINENLNKAADKGTSYYLGFGVNQVFQKNHMIYMDFEYEHGENFKRPWSYLIGFRKSW